MFFLLNASKTVFFFLESNRNLGTLACVKITHKVALSILLISMNLNYILFSFAVQAVQIESRFLHPRKIKANDPTQCQVLF